MLLENPFGALIFSGRVSSALENRAFREKQLLESDFRLATFCTPAIRPSHHLEDTALDLICLYERITASSSQFSIENLNKKLGVPFLNSRHELVRDISVAFSAAKRQRRKQNAFDITEAEFNRLKTDSEREAAYLFLDGFDYLVEDARRHFEASPPRLKWQDHIILDHDIPHSAIKRFLGSFRLKLTAMFADNFRNGTYNHRIGLLELEELASGEPLRQFKYFMRSDRFLFYFEQLQDSYADFYENSFQGRYYDDELVYNYEPVHKVQMVAEPNGALASQVIRVNLADVVDYFPLPRTLAEAIDFREHPRLAAFRHTLERWLQSVATASQLEQKIRRDLQIANRDLSRLARIRALKERPLLFGIKTALSLVPVVSTAITLVDAIDYFYERRTSARWAWIVPNKGRLD
jgi:hypothetical protein